MKKIKQITHNKMDDLITGIIHMYLSMEDVVERDKALGEILKSSCLSKVAKNKLALIVGEKNPTMRIPIYDEYNYDAFQDYLIDEIIQNSKYLTETDFKHLIYNELMAFIDNPLFPFEKPTCSYGIWEDVDDYTYEHVEKIKNK